MNMVDHMIAGGELEPVYIVSPCFYDPKETDKTRAGSCIRYNKAWYRVTGIPIEYPAL